MSSNLKKLIAIAVVAVPALIASGFASAANTVTFQGEVTDQTCSATINGQTNSTVLLPTVSASSLSASGQTAGQTPFTLTISGCGSPANALAVSTSFLGHSVLTGAGYGVLGNLASGGATNVGIQLVDPLNAPITLTGGIDSVNTGSIAAGADGASFDFAAQYYATGVAGAGAVTSMVDYAVSYQ